MRNALNILWTSFRIGWENESNWTWRPVYFFYAAIRPFAMCLILYFLFRAATADPSTNPTFMAVYISNAFFTIFMAVSAGIGWVIIEDREFFRIIKYIYIAPMRFSLYVFGRTLLVLSVSIVTTAIILAFGILVLKLPIVPSAINLPLLAGSFVLGLLSSASLGMILAGVVLITARHSTLLAEGVGGAFLLLCGVIYPIDFLPAVWRAIAQGIPLTYWMEATRRAFALPPFGATMEAWTTGHLIVALAGFAMVYIVASIALFNLLSYVAKKLGKVDQTTHY